MTTLTYVFLGDNIVILHIGKETFDHTKYKATSTLIDNSNGNDSVEVILIWITYMHTSTNKHYIYKLDCNECSGICW